MSRPLADDPVGGLASVLGAATGGQDPRSPGPEPAYPAGEMFGPADRPSDGIAEGHIVRLRAILDEANALGAVLAERGVVMRVVPCTNMYMGNTLDIDRPEPDKIQIVLVMPAQKLELKV